MEFKKEKLYFLVPILWTKSHKVTATIRKQEVSFIHVFIIDVEVSRLGYYSQTPCKDGVRYMPLAPTVLIICRLYECSRHRAYFFIVGFPSALNENITTRQNWFVCPSIFGDNHFSSEFWLKVLWSYVYRKHKKHI